MQHICNILYCDQFGFLMKEKCILNTLFFHFYDLSEYEDKTSFTNL